MEGPSNPDSSGVAHQRELQDIAEAELKIKAIDAALQKPDLSDRVKKGLETKRAFSVEIIRRAKESIAGIDIPPVRTDSPRQFWHNALDKIRGIRSNRFDKITEAVRESGSYNDPTIRKRVNELGRAQELEEHIAERVNYHNRGLGDSNTYPFPDSPAGELEIVSRDADEGLYKRKWQERYIRNTTSEQRKRHKDKLRKRENSK